MTLSNDVEKDEKSENFKIESIVVNLIEYFTKQNQKI